MIAGKILPASSTTTSLVAALQTIEAVKILSVNKRPQIKNSFINLATPFICLSDSANPKRYYINRS